MVRQRGGEGAEECVCVGGGGEDRYEAREERDRQSQKEGRQRQTDITRETGR